MEHSHAQQLVESATTLSADEVELLRGTHLRSILRRGAAILSSSSGSESSYGLSMPVDSIDYFISHNWSVRRRNKFLSLALHFNFSFAIVVMCILIIICFVANVSSWVPFFELKGMSAYELDYPIPVTSVCLSFPVFLTALLFKQELLPCISGPRCFLDKTCIHQTDIRLKRKGIEKLGVFLSASSYITMLYTDIYLKKLWTSYEMACFTLLRKSHNVKVIHVSFTEYFFKTMCIFYMVRLVALPLSRRRSLLAAIYWLLSYLLPAMAWTIVSRHAQRTLISTCGDISAFKVQNALCSDESDRPHVESIIIAVMISQKIVTENDGPDKALESFNNLVRSQVLRTMRLFLGGSPMPIRFLVVLLMGSPAWDVCSAIAKKNGFLSGQVWCYALHQITTSGTMLLISRLLDVAMSYNMHFCGCKERAYMVTTLCVILSAGLLCDKINMFLSVNSVEDPRFVALFVPYNLIILMTTVLVFVQRHRQRQASFALLDKELANARRLSFTAESHVSTEGQHEAIGRLGATIDDNSQFPVISPRGRLSNRSDDSIGDVEASILSRRFSL